MHHGEQRRTMREHSKHYLSIALTLFQAHVGFPDPSIRSSTYPEGHGKACARTELDKCEQRPFPRAPLPSAPRSPLSC
ncbi:uncharacterized protein LAESUDRAFT_729167 [Laetiporus sulphureus 93-53]|uniref:Uncharacterized protein n=1 Tax=Laetiporus sulphureus 93-53 TaxID=1314785 RepID=A0A165CWG9_9APHY|nr:uncharacterized protein LAESUDRAFT_729167 [Laetiporus sulphureus 93-53]KZT03586.1 hypothetical protein LAESUDRAFT_729167 [Laetiporus sulphureus 93-53]